MEISLAETRKYVITCSVLLFSVEHTHPPLRITPRVVPPPQQLLATPAAALVAPVVQHLTPVVVLVVALVLLHLTPAVVALLVVVPPHHTQPDSPTIGVDVPQKRNQ